MAEVINLPLLLVSRINIEIALYNLHSENAELYHSVRDLITLKNLINEVIDNLVMDSDNLKFVSSSTVYCYNNGATVVATSLHMNPT